MYYTFLETLDKIKFNGNDSSNHDPHQEGQYDQECPPSSKRFLMVIFPLKTLFLYIFENLGQNTVKDNESSHSDPHQEDQDDD